MTKRRYIVRDQVEIFGKTFKIKWKNNEKTTIRKSEYMQNMHIAQNLVHFHYLKSILICLGGKGEYFMPILKYRNVRQLDH